MTCMHVYQLKPCMAIKKLRVKCHNTLPDEALDIIALYETRMPSHFWMSRLPNPVDNHTKCPFLHTQKLYSEAFLFIQRSKLSINYSVKTRGIVLWTSFLSVTKALSQTLIVYPCYSRDTKSASACLWASKSHRHLYNYYFHKRLAIWPLHSSSELICPKLQINAEGLHFYS